MTARGLAGPPDPFERPIRPMLAAEGETPVGSAWAFEFDWDGLRAVAYLRPGRVHVLSGASERAITASYPELAALGALAEVHGGLVLDGKIVALDERGRPDAAVLRKRMSTPRPSPTLRQRAQVRFCVSDLLHLADQDTLVLPYRRRRELLAELDLTGLPALLSPYFVDTDGQTMLRVARDHGLAAVLGKRLDSCYQAGRRSRAWVRTALRQTCRVVVGGWQPGGSATSGGATSGGIIGGAAGGGVTGGALLVGVPAPAGLRYVGRVTAGLDSAARRALADPLETLVCPHSPFAEPPPERHQRGVRWVAPTLVGTVAYRRAEPDGRLRHISWVGLCADGGPGNTGASPEPDPPAPTEVTVDPDASLTALTEAVRLAQAEVRALRAQISSHFVYNALTTISSYVRTDPPRARELLGEFAEYTRYSFRSSNAETTLGAELANVRCYLALEQARFDGRLRVTQRVDEQLREVAVPFMTLQPLVEHAVRHGIEGTPSGGTLRIVAAADGPDCVVTVAEDVGVHPQRLAEVTADVRTRLVAAGHQDGVEVHTDDTGTSVTVRVPRRPS